MSEMKKLFRRDKWFLVVTVILILVMFSIWGTTYQKTMRTHQMDVERVNAEIIERGLEISTISESDMKEMIAEDLNWFFVMLIQMMGSGMLILQIIKWQMYEGKKARGLQQILPIKTSTYITYDYLWGVLFGWVPTILLSVWVWGTLGYPTAMDMIVFLVVEMFMYSLFVFSKNVTNHIPGAFLFYELLIYFEAIICTFVFEQESLAYTWSIQGEVIKTPYVFMTVYTLLTVLFVWLSYICGKKRDLSGNGMFSYKMVHLFALIILFIMLILLFGSVYYVKGAGVWRILLVGVLAIGITGGTHYLIRPKKI